MKSFAFAAVIAAVASAVDLEQQASGYVIDLCPSDDGAAFQPAAIQLPGREDFRNLQQVASMIENRDLLQNVGTINKLETLHKLGQLNELNQMHQMFKTQQAIKEGVATAALAEMVGDWDKSSYYMAPATKQVKAIGAEQRFWATPASTIERFEDAEKLSALASAFNQQKYLRKAGSQNIILPGSQDVFQARQILAPATYNLPVGIVEKENFLPSASDRLQETLAMIPGADRSDSYVSQGVSYVPDSYTPGNYRFDASCIGQPVTVYPEREPEVLFCGERNLQGNQTLKRTNIFHNYVHDINHQHNYHNRTRHAAKQFNTLEKDCSCKGVAVEGSYKCPPGIQQAAAIAVGGTFLDRPVGAYQIASALDRDDDVLSCTCQ